MLSTLQSLLLVAVNIWGQCCSAEDQDPWPDRLQDKTYVTVLHSTTHVIKVKAEHINTHPHFTPPPALPTDDGFPTLQHGFTTFPIFSTEAYEVEECQFDNDDPGFSKCHTSTTTVTYVNGISTSYFDDVPTDNWTPPLPPFTTPTWAPTSVIPLPTILPTTPTPHYPHPPSSYAPPWETSLDLCDVFSATWCQSTSRTASNSYSHSHSYQSTFTTIFDSCLTSSHWWCLSSTTTTPPTPFTSTHNATTLSLQPTLVCVSHNFTSTCFTQPPPRPTNTTLLSHITASSGLWNSTSTIVAWPTNGTATMPVNLTSLVVPPQVTTAGLPPFLNSTAVVPAATSILPSLNETSRDISATQVQHPKHSLSKHESAPTWLPATQKPARTTSTLVRGHADGGHGKDGM